MRGIERFLGVLPQRLVNRYVKQALEPNSTKETKEHEVRDPNLVLINTPQVLGNVDPQLHGQIDDLKRDIYGHLLVGFAGQGCNVIGLRDEYSDAPHINSPYAMMINPVFLGKLSPKTRNQLEKLKEEYPNQHEWDEGYRDNIAKLRDLLPEVTGLPLIGSIGARLCEKMGIEPKVHQNFINMVFVDDSNGLIRGLPYQWIRVFNWMQMAKTGSFKTIIVPYNSTNGEVNCHEVMYATLEGGHPRLSLAELSKALIPFGSAKKAGNWETANEFSISQTDWEKSKTVSSLIELGKYLGDRQLLSPPVEIDDYVAGRGLKKAVRSIAQFSRQAEGAFMAYDPQLKRWIVTASGRFGAVKTKLRLSDLLAIVPSRKRKSMVWKIPVQGYDDPEVGPSVEAEEFTFPPENLLHEDPVKYGTRVLKTENGYQEVSEGGELMPAVRGVIHLHRWIDVDSLSDDVILVPNIEKYPAVGCGVDKMQEMSENAMRRAIEEWNRGGRKAKATVFYVPNHGCNIFLFSTANKDGVIPEDPTEMFKELVDTKQLNFQYEVPQTKGTNRNNRW